MSTVTADVPPPREGRVRQFWRRVTDGLEAQQLWDQFRSESRASYELYRREVDWEAREKEKGMARALRIAGQLFWAILTKLSPARRVVLLAALLFSAMGDGSFSIGEVSISYDLRWLGFLLLLVLLVLELSDRVTMKRDLQIARDIQRWLVPERPPEVPGAEIAFTTRPANTVGGDYYDAFMVDRDRRRLVLAAADVAGKGVPAALLMATFQACLHAVAEGCRGPVELADRLNHFACSRSLEGRRFTTAFLAELNLDDFTLVYVNAGHNSPVLRRAARGVERLERGGLPFGIDPGARYGSGSAQLEPGDLLLIFTDGLVEAVNASDAEYGEGRMLDELEALRGRNASETVRGLMDSVDRFVAGARQYDDITCLVTRREPSRAS